MIAPLIDWGTSMATVQVEDNYFDIEAIHGAWSAGFLRKTSATKYTLSRDDGTSYGMELVGSGFQYTKSGDIKAGTIKSISLIHVDGSTQWTMSGLSLNANAFRIALTDSSFDDKGPLLKLFAPIALTVYGASLDDKFFGGQKADTFLGSFGSDTFVGGSGKDAIDGGIGDYDVVDYSRESGGRAIKVDLEKGTATDTYGFVDSIKNVELIIGTGKADSFMGSKTASYEAFSGGAGADIINGGGGTHNTVRYDITASTGVIVELAGNPDGSGFGRSLSPLEDDRLIGIQDVVGTRSDDTIIGSNENNILSGLAGADHLDGGRGIDTVDYSLETGWGTGIRVNLEQLSGYDLMGKKDDLISIENVTGSGSRDFITGSQLKNTLLGLDGNDTLRGLAGNDRLSGGDGADILFGGLGKDILTGGSGHDTFVFDSTPNAVSNVDRIVDFSVSDDRIRLDHPVFAALAKGHLTSDAFIIGAKATDADHRILYNSKTGAVSYDADGNGGASAVQFATLDANLKLTADDFYVL
ncbi:calcium-binding protein [Methylobacterium sp. CM6244]